MTNTGIVVRTWNDAPISRRDSDGYADATAMCQANAKHLPHYLSNQRTTEYIAALADATGLQPAQLVITTTTGPNHLRGTWIHPRLAVDLARWISPAFAVWMDGWFLDAAHQSPQPAALPDHHCQYCGKPIDNLNGRRYCSAACRKRAWRRAHNPALMASSPPPALSIHQPAPTLPHGVHVVANSHREASWLWALAVEKHVGQALMAKIVDERQRHITPSVQLHLLNAA
jgi:predicted nucleic acid-binding Zn ribbon protein